MSQNEIFEADKPIRRFVIHNSLRRYLIARAGGADVRLNSRFSALEWWKGWSVTWV